MKIFTISQSRKEEKHGSLDAEKIFLCTSSETYFDLHLNEYVLDGEKLIDVDSNEERNFYAIYPKIFLGWELERSQTFLESHKASDSFLDLMEDKIKNIKILIEKL